MELATNTITADSRIGIQSAMRETIVCLLGIWGWVPRTKGARPELRASRPKVEAGRLNFLREAILLHPRGQVGARYIVPLPQCARLVRDRHTRLRWCGRAVTFATSVPCFPKARGLCILYVYTSCWGL